MESRGKNANPQGKPYGNKHGKPLLMLIKRATGRHKKTKFRLVGKGVRVAHSTSYISRRVKPWERKGRRFQLGLGIPEGSVDYITRRIIKDLLEQSSFPR